MDRDLNRYQEDYAANPFEGAMVEIRRKMVLNFLRSHDLKNILEVGCGGYPLFEDLENFESFVVVDPGLNFCERARAAAALHSKPDRIQIHQVPFEDFEPSESIDCIVISSLLHELADPAIMLRHGFKMAPSDCWLHVNVPNARSFHRLLAVESGLIRNVYEKSATQIRMQQSHTFDLESLAELVRTSGFEIVESGSYFIKPFTHAQMQQLIETGLLTKNLIEGLMGMERHAPGLGAEIFVNAQK